MNLLNFFRRFPSEESCRIHFRKMRQKVGIKCKKCQYEEHYWLPSKKQFQCKSCRFRTTLRSGTIMEASNLPFRYWYIAIHLMTSMKKPVSALELQRHLGHSRYEPVWYMMHKIRAVMGKADQKYQLNDYVEIDEGFFETAQEQPKDPATGKPEPLKRGRGSQQKTGVLVMASTTFDHKHTKKRKKHRPNTAFRYVRMVAMKDFKSSTINEEVQKHVSPTAIAVTDGFSAYSRLQSVLDHHLFEPIPPQQAGKKLPWVHIMISNAKRNFLGIYHSIKDGYAQAYLNEFCYKVNRRHLGEEVFNRMMKTSVSLVWHEKLAVV